MVDEPSDLNGLEQQLRGLEPRAARLNRDRLMFEAGRAAAAPGRNAAWTWPAVSSLLLVAFLVQTARLAQPQRHDGQPVANRTAAPIDGDIGGDDGRQPLTGREATEVPSPPPPAAQPAPVRRSPGSRGTWNLASQPSSSFFATREIVTRVGVDGLPAGGGLGEPEESVRSFRQWREVLNLNLELPASLDLNSSPSEATGQGTT
jgi:hypothetical protein